MAAATANAVIEGRGEGGIVPFAVKASTHIYRNTAVGVDPTVGYARPATAGATPDIRCGIAREEVDNSSGASGAKKVEVYTEGEFLLTGSGLAQTDVGSLVYWSDDSTITKTSTNNVLAGRITETVSATQAWVRLLPFAVAS